MKQTLAAGITALLLFGCVETETSVDRVSGRNLQGGFGPNEEMVSYPSLRSVSRRGVDAQTGIPYSYSSSRRAEVQTPDGNNWLGGCISDPIRDTQRCHLNLPRILHVFVDGSGSPETICIASHDFPGRRGAIRVAGAPMMRSNENGCFSGSAAKAIERQLQRGGTVYTEYYEWPYDHPSQRSAVIGSSFPLAQRLFRFSRNAPAELFSQR